jgi:hypothetical protein
MNMQTTRRGLAALLAVAVIPAAGRAEEGAVPWEQYLRESAVDPGVIARFLDDEAPNWARFDPELGYVLGSSFPVDGIDGTRTISTAADPTGARTARLYTNSHRPCRINTYGNSFTQCHQVSDGETWQEYLAGHLGEPIRNFGMGGYGVYQSYRRMLREEQTGHGAENLIFYIWGDDHIRSLLRCRHAIIHRVWDHDGGRMFHNNFWANVEMNLETGALEEMPNLLATREDLRRMSDPEAMVSLLEDDLALRMMAFARGWVRDVDRDRVRRLAEILGEPTPDFEDDDEARGSVAGLLEQYGFEATKLILTRVRAFAETHGKNLLVVLFDPYGVLPQLIETGTRRDQEIVDFLSGGDFKVFDTNVVHAEDFRHFDLPLEDYLKRYFIGHYSPAGNHFFAYAIRGPVVEMLDPKPLPYQPEGHAVDFGGYLAAPRP